MSSTRWGLLPLRGTYFYYLEDMVCFDKQGANE